MFLFVLCSLFGWLCELPQQPLPVVVPTPVVTQTSEIQQPVGDTNRYYGKGPVWAGISEFDTGYCDGFWPYEGGGGLSLSAWPIDMQYREVRPERAFGQHQGYLHTGIDFDMPAGSNVYAAGGGVVVWAGYSTYGFGQLIAIHHGGGWISLYGHLGSVGVVCGQSVTAGQLIGTSFGTPGFNHLHLEIRQGFWAYSPIPYLP